MSSATRRHAIAFFAAALVSVAPATTARIVIVTTPDGPVYTNVPEPAADIEVRLSDRSLRYRPLIARAASRHGVAPALVEAVMACESNFDPQAVSRAGACGLMELMPQTARRYGLEDPFDVAGNVDVGARHLAGLLRTFEGDQRLAIAAYNAGAGAVRRAGGIPAFPETRRYVGKVSSYLALLEGAPVAVARADGTALASPVPSPRSAPTRQSIRMGRDGAGRLVLTNLPGERNPER